MLKDNVVSMKLDPISVELVMYLAVSFIVVSLYSKFRSLGKVTTRCQCICNLFTLSYV